MGQTAIIEKPENMIRNAMDKQMMRTKIPTLMVLMSLLAGGAMASGQRTETITPERIETYPVIDMQAPDSPGQVLHYVGSTSRWHLLMITRTAVSRNASGQLGMPWDTVFAYKVPVTDLAIDNGWRLDETMLNNGVTAHPRTCPQLVLQTGRQHIVLPEGDLARKSCLAD